MKKTARVIITYACDRKCPGCCNTMEHDIQNITDIKELKEYKEIVITGGEPLLYPQEVLDFINELRKQDCKIFLYTAKTDIWKEKYAEILKQLDGITVTLHAECTDDDIRNLQLFAKQKVDNYDARLFIDTRVYDRYDVSNIDFSPWNVVRKLRWKKECHPAPNEDLLYFSII